MTFRYLKMARFIITVGIIVTIQGCGEQPENSTHVKEYGSATFSIEWPDYAVTQQHNIPMQTSAITYIDCAVLGVSTITATFTNNISSPVSGSWSCSAHSGRVDGIPAGAGWTITVSAKDGSGNVLYQGSRSGIAIVAGQNTNIGAVSLEAVNPQGLTAIISSPSGPQTITEGQTVNFQGSATGGLAPYTYQWTFSGVAASSSAQNPGNIIFNTPGTFTVTLRVSDSYANTATTSVVITVREAVNPQGLTAIISSPSGPQTITEGQAVNFQGSATGGLAPYTYQWTFSGVAASSSAQNPGNIIFNTPGTFTVTLRVSDSYANTATTSVVITVQPLSGYSTLFFDNFDSYSLGSFPDAGGWQLLYNGAGNSYQYVDNTHTVSGTQSLHLVGSSCWSAAAFHPVNNIPMIVSVEANVFIEAIVGCGCEPQIATVRLENPSIGTWGTIYGAVTFNCDGNVYGYQSNDNSSILLMPYTGGRWYHVKLVVDLGARKFSIYIDGTLRASNLNIVGTGNPTGVYIDAGDALTPVVWFDDVHIYSSSN